MINYLNNYCYSTNYGELASHTNYLSSLRGNKYKLHYINLCVCVLLDSTATKLQCGALISVDEYTLRPPHSRPEKEVGKGFRGGGGGVTRPDSV